MLTEDQLREALFILTQRAGRTKSKAKAAAARENGKMGGRPRRYPKCPRYGAHRFVDDRCPCGFKRRPVKR